MPDKPVPPIDLVKKVLGDFELRMREILEGAWEDWQSMSHRGLMSPRSRASVIFDFIKARALMEFDGDPNIHAIPKGQTVHFLFYDSVLVRFKKADSAGLGSNIKTQAVIDFIDPPFPLFALPPIFNVEVCYQLDKLATRMERLVVTARQGNKKHWDYELGHPASGAVVPLPEPPRADSTPPEVRPRKRVDKSDSDSRE
jgi:hypothetical protein